MSTNTTGIIIGYEINVKGYHEYYGNAYAIIKFEIIIEGGIYKLISVKFNSSKGKITPDDKCNEIRKLLDECIENKTKIKILSSYKKDMYGRKIYPTYKISTKDKVYLTIDKILNGNK